MAPKHGSVVNGHRSAIDVQGQQHEQSGQEQGDAAHGRRLTSATSTFHFLGSWDAAIASKTWFTSSSVTWR